MIFLVPKQVSQDSLDSPFFGDLWLLGSCAGLPKRSVSMLSTYSV